MTSFTTTHQLMGRYFHYNTHVTRRDLECPNFKQRLKLSVSAPIIQGLNGFSSGEKCISQQMCSHLGRVAAEYEGVALSWDYVCAAAGCDDVLVVGRVGAARCLVAERRYTLRDRDCGCAYVTYFLTGTFVSSAPVRAHFINIHKYRATNILQPHCNTYLVKY